ncbi:MAG: hypothetical protein FWF10_08710 [Clostridiales bacterium]|nr:hypothetical protein [Clostridiales bacterium]
MSARRLALAVLIDVIEDGAYANLRLAELSGEEPERAWIYAATWAVLENLYYIDTCLLALCARQKRVQRNILRLGAAELLYMRTPAHAAVSEAVRLCRETGKGASMGLVNAVLRKLARQAEEYMLPPLPAEAAARLSMQYACPAWILREWMADYGAARTEAMLAIRQEGLTLRAQYPYTTEELIAALDMPVARGAYDDNALHIRRGFALPAHPLFAAGKMTAQGEASMAVCRALGDLRGAKVLDACAAPGGKSAYLWSLAGGDIDLTAWELHPHRAALLDKTLARLHVRAKTACRDAAVPDGSLPERFDAVLLDVPCTGFLSARDNHKSEADADAIAGTQRRILQACAAYVKPGGRLLYATCTLSRRENGAQIAAFLGENAEYILEEEGQLLPDGRVSAFYHALLRRACKI